MSNKCTKKVWKPNLKYLFCFFVNQLDHNYKEIETAIIGL